MKSHIFRFTGKHSSFINLCTIIYICLFISACSSGSESINGDNNKKTEDEQPIEIVSTSELSANDIYSAIYSKLTSSKSDILTILSKISTKTTELGLKSVISDVVRYKSIGVNGKELTLSGKFYLPNQTASIRGIIIANHYTITSNAEAPSQSLQIEAACALLGYAVVLSDYIGFGETKSLPQTYLAADITAKSSVDLALAGYQYLKNKNYKLANSDNAVYILGYSQGGAVALSVQKMIENTYSNKFRILKTIAGAGPYDITATYNEMLTSNTSNISAVPALVLIGLNYSETLNVDFSKYFQTKLLNNYQDWINSKNYTTTQIASCIGTTKVSDMLTAAACNTESDEMKPFLTAFKKNSLIDWIPKAPMLLFHSTKDDVVPEINSLNAYNSFRKNSTANIETDFNDYGTHSAAGLSFYMKVFDEIY